MLHMPVAIIQLKESFTNVKEYGRLKFCILASRILNQEPITSTCTTEFWTKETYVMKSLQNFSHGHDSRNNVLLVSFYGQFVVLLGANFLVQHFLPAILFVSISLAIKQTKEMRKLLVKTSPPWSLLTEESSSKLAVSHSSRSSPASRWNGKRVWTRSKNITQLI